MSRLQIPTFEQSPEASHAMLEAVNKKLGVLPHLFRLIGSSPAALTGYMGLSGALAKVLDARTRERIALVVSQINGCDYCLSAHSYIAKNMMTMTEEEIALNREGKSADPKAGAAVAFAAAIASQRGQVTDWDVEAVREAGFSDAQIVEIVALVADTTFTNFLNNVAQTEIDFPLVRSNAKAEA
ncbi:carboxymuconolactone decarboxylase family protein [Enterobacteriaceae bacterium C34A]